MVAYWLCSSALLMLLSSEGLLGRFEDRKPQKGIILVLEADKNKVPAKQKIALNIWIANSGDRTVLFNGRLIPSEKGAEVVEPLDTPMLVWFSPDNQDPQTKREKNIRYLFHLRDVHELPPDSNYKIPLVHSLDRDGKRLRGYVVESPARVGKWIVMCQVIMPHPDPKAKETIAVESNRITIEVQKE